MAKVIKQGRVKQNSDVLHASAISDIVDVLFANKHPTQNSWCKLYVNNFLIAGFELEANGGFMSMSQFMLGKNDVISGAAELSEEVEFTVVSHAS